MQIRCTWIKLLSKLLINISYSAEYNALYTCRKSREWKGLHSSVITVKEAGLGKPVAQDLY